MTPKNGRFHEINRAFVLACRLLRKVHAGGKKLTALLNLDKPIIRNLGQSKHALQQKIPKIWEKYT